MTQVETAKPCPLKEEKKPKRYIFDVLMGFAGRAFKCFLLVDKCYAWLKKIDWASVWEWINSHLL